MTDEPVFWRNMTHEQKGAILLAYHKGKVIEWTGKGGSAFSRSTAKGFTPVWSNDHAYRVRPDTTLAEALDAQPGFTADDLRRAWELCREEAAARAFDRSVQRAEHSARLIELDYPEAFLDSKNYDARSNEAGAIRDEIRALTPPADLADKVKKGRDNGIV